MFTKNIGALDRTLRVFLGLLILSLAFIGPQTPWGYLGLVGIATGAISFCPIYRLFGKKSCNL